MPTVKPKPKFHYGLTLSQEHIEVPLPKEPKLCLIIAINEQ